ncbi:MULTISPECIES: hypothetical protein [unclassified Chelatococcus]|uniref:hypothetical protein n=1 Tax=unclassified Chelatococcus TaxID=2638111 RepID=UPI001BD15E23|nr:MULTISPECIES: hypothetical protein [unclassified Chelatococcus]MBS7699502.1 hypothetical protein [Chelatococcus sp. YT9]MBX3559579.1 hypothetical protein [Chelatococcus sp.]
MYNALDKHNISIRPSLDVYLPWEGNIVHIGNVNDAIVVVQKLIEHEPDPCWAQILSSLLAADSVEAAKVARRDLRTEFLLRGMMLPEDADAPVSPLPKARPWWRGVIDKSHQLEIELPHPLHA